MNLASLLTDTGRDTKEATLQDNGSDGLKQQAIEEDENVSEFASGSPTSERASLDQLLQAVNEEVNRQRDQSFLSPTENRPRGKLEYSPISFIERPISYSPSISTSSSKVGERSSGNGTPFSSWEAKPFTMPTQVTPPKQRLPSFGSLRLLPSQPAATTAGVKRPRSQTSESNESPRPKRRQDTGVMAKFERVMRARENYKSTKAEIAAIEQQLTKKKDAARQWKAEYKLAREELVPEED